MKKATLNYWVDLVTAVAFLVSGVTGILFLFPSLVHVGAGGTPTIAGLSASFLHTLHDWTGVAMVAGVALHLLLHTRWIVTMTRRVMLGEPAGRRAGSGPGRSQMRPAGSAPAGLPAGALAVAASDAPARPVDRRRPSARTYTRRRFVAGAAAVGGAALLTGVGLAGRASPGAASTQTGESQDGSGTSGGNGYGSSGGSSTGDSSGSSTGGATTTTVARVTVDQGRCIGCGHCLQACPYGVFSADGSTVVAQNPDACRLCGRCTHVCGPAAITLHA